MASILDLCEKVQVKMAKDSLSRKLARRLPLAQLDEHGKDTEVWTGNTQQRRTTKTEEVLEGVPKADAPFLRRRRSNYIFQPSYIPPVLMRQLTLPAEGQ